MSAARKSTTMTHTDAEAIVAAINQGLPAAVEIGIGAATITAVPQISKGGNVWYHADLQSGDMPVLKDGQVQSLLNRVPVTVGGETITPDEHGVHLSQPRKYTKTHAKAGQAVPGSGNNLTVAFVGQVLLSGKPYAVKVQVTYLVKGDSRHLRYGVAVNTMERKAREPKVVGAVSGSLDIW